nr:MAG TPA: hypothetical protein [Bacteriophage sp.]
MGLPFFLVWCPGLVGSLPGLFYFLGTRVFQLISPFPLCPHCVEWFGWFRLFVSCVPLLIL